MGCKQDFVQIWSTYFPADLANVPKTLIFKHDISSTGRTMNNVILFLHRMNPTASATHAEHKMRLSIAFHARISFMQGTTSVSLTMNSDM